MTNLQSTIEISESLKEKLEKKTYGEVSLHAKEQQFNQVIYQLEEKLKLLTAEKQMLTDEVQSLISKTEKLQSQLQLEAKTVTEWKKSQLELSEFKQQTFAFLEKQKSVLTYIVHNTEQAEKEYSKLKKELLKKEVALKDSLQRYQKIKTSKLMKWTENYWKLIKKLQLKNK